METHLPSKVGAQSHAIYAMSAYGALSCFLPFTWHVTVMLCDLSLWQWVMTVRLQFGPAVFVERSSEWAHT